ncbi:MAG: metal-dependent hydrolase [Patescibacteria group bacterium]
MTGKTHQILGLTTGLTYYLISVEPTYAPATLGAVLVFSYLAALLPDIDQPGGKLWHMLPFGHTLGKISDPFLEHRNLTHSFLGTVLVAIGFYFLFKSFPTYWGINTQTVFIASIVSYLSHLFADLWTNEGIPIFFPYKRFFGLPPKPFDGFRVATGKWFENLVIFPILTVFLIVFVLVNFSLIKIILFK